MRSASNDITAFAQKKVGDHRHYYNVPDVVKAIRELAKLSPSEQAILAILQDQLKGQPILDVGIGAGRTTPYLRELSADYVGIDLSVKMIESARERFPDARLLQRDAADLSLFAAGEFAAAFFLGAGIDDANPTDRMKILHEIYRVLKPGGMFVLCVHNLRAREASP